MAARSDSRQRADDERDDPTDQQVVALLEAYEEQLLQGTAAPIADWLPEDLPPEAWGGGSRKRFADGVVPVVKPVAVAIVLAQTRRRN